MTTALSGVRCLGAVILAGSLVLPCVAGATHASGPDGTIAVIGGGQARRIYLVSPASGATRRVVAPDDVVALAFSPDGKRIAFSGLTGVWLMASDGSHARRIVDERNAEALAGALDWSPDGKRLAFVRDGVLFTMSADGKDERRVIARADAPDWAGERIVFVRNPESSSRNGTISAVRPDGSGLRRVVSRGRWFAPRVSPDGSKLAFFRNGVAGVYVAAGGKTRRVVRDGTQPTWSPDGRFLAFVREAKCRGEVCPARINVMPANGGTARAIGPALGDMGALSWG